MGEEADVVEAGTEVMGVGVAQPGGATSLP